MKASETKDFVEVSKLLENGADVDEQNEEGETALMKVTRLRGIWYMTDNGLRKTVNALLRYKPDVNIKDRLNKTVLIAAMKKQDYELANKYLIEGAEIDIQDVHLGNEFMKTIWKKNTMGGWPSQQTLANIFSKALLQAIEKGNLETVQNLSEHLKSCPKDQNGRTALMLATQIGYNEIFRNVFGKYNCPVNERDMNGTTALMLGVEIGNNNIVKTLVKSGAGIDFRNIEGETALTMAVAINYSDSSNYHIVKSLLQTKIPKNVNIRNKKDKTALIIAVETNISITVVKMLLEHGLSIDPHDYEGNTALSVAISRGKVNILKLLLKYKHSIDLLKNGDSVLMQAAKNGNTAITKVLLDKGASTNIENDIGNTALTIAAFNGHSNIVRILLEHGSEVDTENHWGRTPLHYAIGKGHNYIATTLLKHNASNAIHPYSTFEKTAQITALMVAAYVRNQEFVEALLERDSRVEIQDGIGKTALMYAVMNEEDWFENIELFGDDVVEYVKAPTRSGMEQDKIVKSLLTRTDGNSEYVINLQDKHGRTAIMMAALAGSEAIVKILKENKANIFIKDKLGNSVFTYAQNWPNIIETLSTETCSGYTLISEAKSGNVEMVEKLLQSGANIEARDEEGDTALIKAVNGGYVDIVRTILEHNANTEARNQEGDAPLFLATRLGHTEIVKLLIQFYADTTVTNLYGNSPLWAAVEFENENILAVLLENGAFVDHQDSYGSTALMSAAFLNNDGILRRLLEHGASIDLVDDDGDTALIYSGCQNLTIVTTLLQYNASVNVQGSFYTPLLFATSDMSEGDVVGDVVVRKLLEHGAYPDILDNDGQTPLMKASSRGLTSYVNTLMEYNATLNEQDNLGFTALMHAIFKPDFGADEEHEANKESVTVTIMTALLKHGAGVDIQDNSGATALIHATKFGMDEASKILLMHKADSSIRDKYNKSTLDYAEDHKMKANIVQEK